MVYDPTRDIKLSVPKHSFPRDLIPNPKVYEKPGGLGVHGKTPKGESYDVAFMGPNPLYKPGTYGETEDSLLGKIKEAVAAQEEENKFLGIPKTGVIVVTGPVYVTPRPGVAVVHVDDFPEGACHGGVLQPQRFKEPVRTRIVDGIPVKDHAPRGWY